MKPLKAIFILILFSILLACSSDDDNNATPQVQDRIAENLTTSLTAYQNANDGDWVEITEAEYNELFTNLNNVSLCGTNQAEFNSTSASILPLGERTVANYTTAHKIPAQSYFFAFKYSIGTNNSSINTPITTANVRQSFNANNSGFSRIGSYLPSHDNNGLIACFVYKNNSTKNNSSSFLGMYSPRLKNRFFSNEGSAAVKFGPDASDLTSNFTDTKWKYQGLATTQKQW